ncbi:ABC transporter permease [Christensenella intestinihominis]|uniref:ABC transporter permease n=1 Tax=Christensenella intestinihominis TaxID=1851429 RepID=UPI000835FA16|nr:ABC transporter permease [Christensenella intestinihominis]
MEKLQANKKGKNFINTLLMGNKAFLMVIIMVVVMSLLSEAFLTPTNLLNVLRQICVNVVVALGFTFVIASGQIDLSVGSMVGFIGVIMALLMREANAPVFVAILCGFAVGIGCGALNAAVISVFSLPPFVVTLATQSLFRGLIYILTEMTPITRLPDEFVFLGQGYFLGIPVPVYMMAVMIFIMYIVANRTMFGRYVIAVGGNADAARASGISILKTRFGIFMNMGICATVAAIVLTARTASAQVNAGVNMELDVIAAVVIGGTSMLGGNTNMIGTVFGAVVIGLTSNGLNLLGVETNYQIIAKGLLILLALILDSMSAKFYANLRKKQALASMEGNENGNLAG